MEKKSSVGVTIFGSIMLIYSLIWFFYNEIFYLNKKLLAISPYTPIITYSVICYLNGLSYLVLSYGILKLKSWGRILTVIYSVLMTLFFGASAIWLSVDEFINGIGATVTAVAQDRLILKHIWMHIPIFIIFIIIIYLTRPKVKRAFGERNPEHSEG